MIDRLRVGMVLALPGGSTVVLVRRDGPDWVCQYTDRVRGEVVFSGRFLRRHAALA